MTQRIERPTDEIVNAMDIAIRKHPVLSMNEHPSGTLATLLSDAGSTTLPGITSTRAYFWVTGTGGKLALIIEDVLPEVRNPKGDFIMVAVNRARFTAAERKALEEIYRAHS